MKKKLCYSMLASIVWLTLNNLNATALAMENPALEQTEPATLKQQWAEKNSGIQFVCPMHPEIVGNEGDSCPICGMNLEPREMDMGAMQNFTVEVDGNMQQALNIRTQKAKRGTLWQYTSTVGTVNYDQSNISHLHSRVTGWIEKLNVQSMGDKVNKGDLLYTLYSPELIKAQEDYLLTAKTAKSDPRNTRFKELAEKALMRLELLGMDKSAIAKIKKTGKSLYRVPFYAPRSGIIQTLNVREGMYIQPATEITSVVDLNSIWVIADLFESAQPWIKQGLSAEINIPAQNIYRLKGKVDYIYPDLDPQTRNLKVRIALENPNQKLKINSFVEVNILGETQPKALLIPIEALIQTGKNNRVVIQNSDGSFSVKPVQIGIVSQDNVEILAGIEEGDNIVLSGQFLLDSEASLKGSLQRIAASNESSESKDNSTANENSSSSAMQNMHAGH